MRSGAKNRVKSLNLLLSYSDLGELSVLVPAAVRLGSVGGGAGALAPAPVWLRLPLEKWSPRVITGAILHR